MNETPTGSVLFLLSGILLIKSCIIFAGNIRDAIYVKYIGRGEKGKQRYKHFVNQAQTWQENTICQFHQLTLGRALIIM